MKSLFLTMAAVFAASGISFAASPADEGKILYSAQKYNCAKCHGPTGAEGGMGPSFKGVGKKYDKTKLMERAAHNCPPTGTCSPKDLGAIVDYLRTL